MKAKRFMCGGCGDWFEYQRRRPKFCDECRRIKLNASIQRYKKRRRKMEAHGKGDREEKFGGKSNFVEQIGGAQHAEIARVLNMDFREVQKLERQALMKIREQFRDNPELKDLWGSLKEELAAGAVMPAGHLGAANKGNLLLDYQQAVADWLQFSDALHDEIKKSWQTATIDAATREAAARDLEEMQREIEKFQGALADALLTI